MPAIFKTHDLKAFKGYYYAHRGLHDGKTIPENSMEAFDLAIKNNYGIELDVQLTKDNIPIIFHDDNLKRVCGINKMVKDCSFEELQRIYLYNSKKRIPHLREVLDLVNGQVPLILEFKLRSLTNSICKIVSSYLDDYGGIYCIESFHPLVVHWYKKNRPSVIRGQLSTKYLFPKKGIGNRLLSFVLSSLLFNFLTRPDFIAYEHKYARNLSLIICRKLYKTPTIAYTIQSQKELEKNYEIFDFFIFDSFTPYPNSPSN